MPPTNLTTAQAHEDAPSPTDVKQPGLSEGILWQRRGFPTVGKEDGDILRWSDQGIRDDVGVGFGSNDGNHHDSDRS